MLLSKMKPTHPGEIIREEFMAPLGLDVDTLALQLAISSDVLLEIISGRAPLTDDIAGKLAVRFKTSISLWTGLQVEYVRRSSTAVRKNRTIRKDGVMLEPNPG
ncbi:MAG: HigA family addiction module antitoxin [Desulfomonilaceae bacterium]